MVENDPNWLHILYVVQRKSSFQWQKPKLLHGPNIHIPMQTYLHEILYIHICIAPNHAIASCMWYMNKSETLNAHHSNECGSLPCYLQVVISAGQVKCQMCSHCYTLMLLQNSHRRSSCVEELGVARSDRIVMLATSDRLTPSTKSSACVDINASHV